MTPEDPGQGPPGARGAGVRARRRQGDPPGRRARARRLQPGPHRAHRPGPLPRGPLLPPERDPDRGAAAPPPEGGHPGPRRRTSSRCSRPRTASGPRPISVEALAYFLSYDWPGNVRELRNMVERLVIMAPRDVIGPEDLPPPLRPKDAAPAEDATRAHPAGRRARPSSGPTSSPSCAPTTAT